MPFAKRTTGITTDSVKSFIIDAGAVYVNYGETDERLLGATTGGSTFTIETEIRDMEIDGVRAPVRGTRRITMETAKITVRLLEMTSENLLIALTGATVADWNQGGTVDAQNPATHDSITRNRSLRETDHIKNIAVIGKVNGSDEVFIGIIYNALTAGGLEFSMEDESESVLEAEFTGFIDASMINDDGTFVSPWEIRVPKITTTP